MTAASLAHLSRLLDRKYGRERGRAILADALMQQRLSGRDIRDVIVEMSNGRLVREEKIQRTIKKQIVRFARQSKSKGYVMKDGVRIYQAGAPGLKQQKHA